MLIRLPYLWTLFLLACSSPTDEPMPPDPDPPWESAAAITTGPIQETGVAAIGDSLYIVGGFNEQRALLSLVSKFDVSQDQWVEVAALPIPIHHPNLGTFDGQLYVLGGLVAGFVETGRSFRYDPAANEWTEIASMPVGSERGSAAVGLVDDRFVVAGGFAGGRSIATTLAYDPIGNSWETGLPNLPEALDHMSFGVVGGELITLGGRRGAITAVESVVYRFAEGAWKSGAPMPTARAGCSAAVLGDRLFVIGGEGNAAVESGVFPQAEAYNPAADSWEVFPPMPTPRHGMGIATIADTIYVPGGADVQGFGAVDVMETLRPGN